MQVTMKDRVAVVTGGSKGLGLAVARQFAASGAKVAILARGAADLKAARELLAKDGLEVRDYVCDVSKAADIAKAHEKIVCRSRPGRHPRQQCRHRADDGVREHHRRGLAGRPRPQTVCRDPLLQAGLAGHEGAQMGPHHQRAQHLRQGAGGVLGADLGIAGGRHGADQGDGERRRRAQHPGQCHAGRPDHERSMGEAARHAGAGHGFRGVCQATSPRARRSGASARRRNSPTSPASSPPIRDRSSPAPPSMSMAAVRRWCSGSFSLRTFERRCALQSRSATERRALEPCR